MEYFQQQTRNENVNDLVRKNQTLERDLFSLREAMRELKTENRTLMEERNHLIKELNMAKHDSVDRLVDSVLESDNEESHQIWKQTKQTRMTNQHRSDELTRHFEEKTKSLQHHISELEQMLADSHNKIKEHEQHKEKNQKLQQQYQELHKQKEAMKLKATDENSQKKELPHSEHHIEELQLMLSNSNDKIKEYETQSLKMKALQQQYQQLHSKLQNQDKKENKTLHEGSGHNEHLGHHIAELECMLSESHNKIKEYEDQRRTIHKLQQEIQELHRQKTQSHHEEHNQTQHSLDETSTIHMHPDHITDNVSIFKIQEIERENEELKRKFEQTEIRLKNRIVELETLLVLNNNKTKDDNIHYNHDYQNTHDNYLSPRDNYHSPRDNYLSPRENYHSPHDYHETQDNHSKMDDHFLSNYNSHNYDEHYHQ